MDIHLDYIRVTYKDSDLEDILPYLELVFGTPLEIHGRYSYQYGYQYSCGAVIYFGNKYMTATLDLPSVALSLLREYYSSEFLFPIFSEFDFKVKRVDLACDGLPLTVNDYYNRFRAGQVNTRAMRYLYVENGENTTFYIGSRSSRRFARVYDEHGFVRYELQLADEYAQQVWDDIILFRYDNEMLSKRIVGHMNTFAELIPVSYERMRYEHRSKYYKLMLPSELFNRIKRYARVFYALFDSSPSLFDDLMAIGLRANLRKPHPVYYFCT